ncbi:MAG: aminoglycoside phosphotransferase family protein [Phycisphaerales bacterium]
MSEPSTSASSGSLGPALEPALIAATQGRLSSIRWFRSDWQRGGGSTALAVYVPQPSAPAIEVVVKVPVTFNEIRWTRELSDRAAAAADPSPPTPRLLAGDVRLGGYDLGWLVLERLPGHPLGAHAGPAEAAAMVAALDRFHVLAGAVSSAHDAPPGKQLDFEKLIAASRAVVKHGVIAESQKWNNELKAVSKALPALLRHWHERAIDTWCHGDLHPGNAMWRHAAAEPRAAVLIDLALVHPGHWVEDALYFERVYWGRSELLGEKSPVALLAQRRRERGVHNPDDYTVVAAAKRVLMAAAAPGMVEVEGNPKYLHAALELIERYLPAGAR